MSRLSAIPALLGLALLAGPAAADPAAAEPAMTRGQADAILYELRQIRHLLETRRQPPSAGRERPPEPAAPPVRTGVRVTGSPVLGAPDAPVTLVEFVDFECPYCRRFARDTWPLLKREYLDSGRVRLVVKDLPLGFHKQARKAAQAAHCAGDQGRYWPMFDRLFSGRAGLNPGALLAYADALGLDRAAFQACLDSDRHLARIDADAAEARGAGIRGTPAFIIGHAEGDRVAGPYIRGALPLPVFKGHIDRQLGQ